MFPQDEVPRRPRGGQLSVLCIDNHASSTYALFLLARSGYKVKCVSFFCDAIDSVQNSSYDVCLINDELARAGKDMLERFREAAGSIPIVFYSTVVYPFSPRLVDQSGDTLETPAVVTEAAIAIARALSHVPNGRIASSRAA